jgi:putative FmdB family regulatory protein
VPIYEYQCTGCAHRFELKQSIKDDPIKECPRCGKDVTKLISSPAIMFKGSGWYITDYSDKMKPGAGSESPEKPVAGGSDKTKTPAASDTAGSSPSTAPAATPAAPASTSSSAPSNASTPSTGSSNSSSSSAA